MFEKQIFKFAVLLWIMIVAGCGPATNSPVQKFLRGTSADLPSVTKNVDKGQLKSCPKLVIRAGTQTWLSPKRAYVDHSLVKLQARIDDFARSCRKINGELVVKIGVRGRLIAAKIPSVAKVTLPFFFDAVDDGQVIKQTTINHGVTLNAANSSANYVLIVPAFALRQGFAGTIYFGFKVDKPVGSLRPGDEQDELFEF